MKVTLINIKATASASGPARTILNSHERDARASTQKVLPE